MVRRRTFLRSVSLTAIGVSGCAESSSGAKENAEIIAGPNTRLVFDPATLTVSAGDTVTWYFDSNGHNVCCVPDDNEVASLPSGAEPFSSYPDGKKHRTMRNGETYSHTFQTPGTYTYVCIPHSPSMQGEIRVTE